MDKKYHLVWYTIMLVCVMYLCFSTFSACSDKRIAYFVPYAIYLTLLLVGFVIFTRNTEKRKMPKIKNKYLYHIAAFIPVVATFIIAFLPTISHIGLPMLLITIVFSVVNGTLEELFWRGTYNQVYKDEIGFAYIIPTILFTCWHFALLLCKGMTYHGGALALVGGAGFMGILWGYIMFRTKNIKVTIAAHVLVNICAFSQLIYGNF